MCNNRDIKSSSEPKGIKVSIMKQSNRCGILKNHVLRINLLPKLSTAMIVLFSLTVLVSSTLAVPPTISDIPGDTIAEGSTFTSIFLNDMIDDGAETTDDNIIWTLSTSQADSAYIIAETRFQNTGPQQGWYADINIQDVEWNGSVLVTFEATDEDPNTVSDTARFEVTYVNDTPIVSGIPDGTVDEGSTFATINLDDFVADIDHADAAMTWTYAGNIELSVSIDGNRIATIGIPDTSWSGSETIIFTATDAGPGPLADSDTAVFTVNAVNDIPIVTDIPDQTIAEGFTFATVNLDGYVSDEENLDSELTWSFFGETDLTVTIDGSRVAEVAIPNTSWYGSEAISFIATDTGSLADTNLATFTVIGFITDNIALANVLVGHADSVPFDVVNTSSVDLTDTGFSPSDAVHVSIHRGGAVVGLETISANDSVQYFAVWDPTNANDSPDSITVSSPDMVNDYTINLTGAAKKVAFSAVAPVSFGDVNSVDILGADSVNVNVDILSNIDGSNPALANNSSNDFSLTTSTSSLINGQTMAIKVVAHPASVGARPDTAWIAYDVALGGGKSIIRDSVKLFDVSANGVEPTCTTSDTLLSFDNTPPGSTKLDSFVISNNSTVTEVVRSLSFAGASGAFVFPDPFSTLVIPAGSTSIVSVSFEPATPGLFHDTLVIFDSTSGGSCDPDAMALAGFGSDAVDWKFSGLDTLGSDGWVPLCGNDGSTLNIEVTWFNPAGDSLIIESLELVDPAWASSFAFDTLAGSVHDPIDLSDLSGRRFDFFVNKELNLYSTYIPVDTHSIQTIKLKLTYKSTTGNEQPKGSVEIPFVRVGACAGLFSAASPQAVPDPVEIGDTYVDSVQLLNAGQCDMTVFSVVPDPNGATFDTASTLTNTVIAPGQTDVYVKFNFTPTSTIGSNGGLIVTHNGYLTGDPKASCSPTNTKTIDTVLLSGTGKDTQGPVISPPTATGCLANDIQAPVVDAGSGVKTVKLLWREGNSKDAFIATSGNMTLASPGVYTKSLSSEPGYPPANVAYNGIEVRVDATDNSNNQSSFETSVSFCVPAVDGGRMITANSWLDGNGSPGQDTLWHLVSFPGAWQTTPSIINIFQTRNGLPALTGNESDSWRLYEYRDHDFPTSNVGFYQLSGNDQLVPGLGYWFRQIGVLDTLDMGEIRTWPTDTAFAITLYSGWNIIGSPYYFPVRIDPNQLDPNISSFYGQKAGAGPAGTGWDTLLSLTSHALEPWKGYAVYFNGASPTDFTTIYLDPKTPLAPAPPQPGDWQANLRLIQGQKEVGTVRLGQNALSREGVDLYDAKQVPFYSKKAALLVSGEENRWLVSDMRSSESALSMWRLKIDVGSSQPLRLTWTKPVLSGPSMSMILKDVVTGEIVNMAEVNQHNINGVEQMPPGRFVIYFGQADAVAGAVAADLSTMPISYRVYQNYPNPFNPNTTISFDIPRPGHVQLAIYNLLGQQVRTIVDNQLATGSYRRDWDGRDESGTAVASGIYFARLITSDYVGTTKMMLLK